MNNKSIFAVLTAVALLAILWFLFTLFYEPKANTPANNYSNFDPLNATYTIEDYPVALTNGKSEIEAAPGSAIDITTNVFGEPVKGDINNDGKLDAALLIVQNPGGTGTFYYAAAAINTSDGAVGTNAIFLGDRIAPQNIEIRNGQIIANYADRRPDEPFSTQPSMGISKYIIFNGTELIETAPNQ